MSLRLYTSTAIPSVMYFYIQIEGVCTLCVLHMFLFSFMFVFTSSQTPHHVYSCLFVLIGKANTMSCMLIARGILPIAVTK